MNIAYTRFNSSQLSYEKQFEELKKYNIEKWFNEKVCLKDVRPQFNAMMDFIRSGDTIYVLDFNRLALSTNELISIGERLNSKEINLRSINDNLDTSNSTGKLMFTMISSIKEFQRLNVLERQKDGIEIAKSNGVYKGRKKIGYPSNWGEVYSKYKDREITGTAAMGLLKLKRNTFYKLLDEYKLIK
ncbi:recombinase family protein [Clostridium lacusfryxellense]|uniref:recombinase family protein n=1 Tax=Clostridium lacusfryxellense TaxID=205328 RepID=UPI001C0BB33C|nr:recombinase family protein [Clostridium lacusfryxellense]MBU3113902.1 recombinase family protein [Clostridium lacusfryxellense]